MGKPTMVVDYTTKALGSRLSQAGTIALCPICHQFGERRVHDAKTKPWLFVHEVEVTAHPRRPATTKILRKCASPTAGETPLASGGDRGAAEPMQGVLGR
jgi:hypothetical protein